MLNYTELWCQKITGSSNIVSDDLHSLIGTFFSMVTVQSGCFRTPKKFFAHFSMILLLSNDPFQVAKASYKVFFVYLTVSTTLYYICGHFFDINYARNRHRVLTVVQYIGWYSNVIANGHLVVCRNQTKRLKKWTSLFHVIYEHTDAKRSEST